MIEIRTFVCKFCGLGQYDKSVCKILRNKELFLILCRKKDSIPLYICRGTFSQIDRNIKNFSAHYTNKFILWIVDLEMKSTKYAFTGTGLVILYEMNINACLFHISFVVGFHEITTLVTMNGR